MPFEKKQYEYDDGIGGFELYIGQSHFQ